MSDDLGYIIPPLREHATPVDDLKIDPANANTHPDKNMRAIRDSLHEFGQRQVIVARENGTVIAGNGRLEAAREMGWSHIACVQVDDDEITAMRYAIADNRSGELSEWDDEVLAQTLDAIREQDDLQGTGFEDDDLDELLSGLGGDVDVSDVPDAQTDRADELLEKWGVERGQLWEAGGHRLLCGDALDDEIVDKLMDGEKAGLVFTDPPYGVSFQSGMANGGTSSRFDKIENDDEILHVAPVVERIMDQDTAAFIWTSHQVYPEWRGQFDAIYKSTIIWHKPGGGIGDLEGDYATDFEMCLFCVNGRPTFNGKRGMAVWEVSKDGVNDYLHPTQKPVELAARAIGDFWENGPVVDLFAGSGSTFIASERSGARCFGGELDPKYCAVILERLSDMGLDPELVED